MKYANTRVPRSHLRYLTTGYNRPLWPYCHPRCPCGLYRHLVKKQR